MLGNIGEKYSQAKEVRTCRQTQAGTVKKRQAQEAVTYSTNKQRTLQAQEIRTCNQAQEGRAYRQLQEVKHTLHAGRQFMNHIGRQPYTF
jgi:hypothetical protein